MGLGLSKSPGWSSHFMKGLWRTLTVCVLMALFSWIKKTASLLGVSLELRRLALFCFFRRRHLVFYIVPFRLRTAQITGEFCNNRGSTVWMFQYYLRCNSYILPIDGEHRIKRKSGNLLVQLQLFFQNSTIYCLLLTGRRNVLLTRWRHTMTKIIMIARATVLGQYRWIGNIFDPILVSLDTTVP